MQDVLGLQDRVKDVRLSVLIALLVSYARLSSGKIEWRVTYVGT